MPDAQPRPAGTAPDFALFINPFPKRVCVHCRQPYQCFRILRVRFGLPIPPISTAASYAVVRNSSEHAVLGGLREKALSPRTQPPDLRRFHSRISHVQEVSHHGTHASLAGWYERFFRSSQSLGRRYRDFPMDSAGRVLGTGTAAFAAWERCKTASPSAQPGRRVARAAGDVGGDGHALRG